MGERVTCHCCGGTGRASLWGGQLCRHCLGFGSLPADEPSPPPADESGESGESGESA